MSRFYKDNELGNVLFGVDRQSETGLRLRRAHGLRQARRDIDGLVRQRDELHETANRYLERARNAEVLYEMSKGARRGLWERCQDAERENAALKAEAEQARAIIDDFAAKVDAGEYLVFKVDVKTPDTPKRSYLVAPLKRLLWVFPLALFVGFLIGAAIVAYLELVAL